MTADSLDSWLEKLKATCTQVRLKHLHLIIDQAGSDLPVLPSARAIEPPLPCLSLFDGLPEASSEAFAPILLQVDLAQPLQRRWLLGLLQNIEVPSRVLALCSAWPFSALAEHLSRCMEAGNGGCHGLLRYYDPRLFPLLFSHVLSHEQQQNWLGPTVFWSWLDRDGIAQHLPGTAELPGQLGPFCPVELSDDQLDTLCCASDATLAIEQLAEEFPPEWGAERRFQACYSAMLEASKAGLFLDAQRTAYLQSRLRDA